MKKLLIILLIFTAFTSTAQIYQRDPAYGRSIDRYEVLKDLGIPTGCGIPDFNSIVINKAKIAYDTCNHKFYVYDPSNSSWSEVTGGVSRQFIDSLLGGYYTKNQTDSIVNLLWPKTTDIDVLQNTTDSSSFGIKKLNGDVKNVVILADGLTGGGGSSIDTTSLSNRINNKWDLSGNSGTDPSINFLGTIDNKSLVFRANNILSGWLDVTNKNTLFGYTGLPLSQTGTYNTAMGYGALAVNTTGLQNNGFGGLALWNNTTGSYNNAFGVSVLMFNTTGSFNVGMGRDALRLNTTGSNNTAIGLTTLRNNTTGFSNMALGVASLFNNTKGNYNTALGDSALVSTTDKSYNIGIGYKAGLGNSTDSSTLFISDSTHNMNFKLDSASGTAPSVIGKDGSGNWHVYQPALGTITGSLSICGTGIDSLKFNGTQGGIWKSMDTSKVFVDPVLGVAHIKATGTPTIITYSVLQNGGYYTAMIPINGDVIPDAGFIADTSSSTVNVGDSIILTRTGGMSGGTWHSSNTAKAIVKPLDEYNAIVYGISAGNASITYNVTNSCGGSSSGETVFITTP